MKFLKAKKGSVASMGLKVGLGIIGVLVLMEIAAAVYPSAKTAGNSLNATGLPLGSFFASGGIIWILLAVAIFVGVVAAFKLSK